MVATLLGLEMKVSGDAERKRRQSVSLVRRFWMREREKARPHLENASRNWPGDAEIADAVAATNYDREDWLSEAEKLMGRAAPSNSSDRRWRRGFGSVPRASSTSRPRPILSSRRCLRAVTSLAPQHEMANFLLERFSPSRIGLMKSLRSKKSASTDSPTMQAKIDLAKRIGNMWLLRWKDKERAARFYGRALNLAYRGTVEASKAFPGHLAAFNLLREVHGARATGHPCSTTPSLAALRR